MYLGLCDNLNSMFRIDYSMTVALSSDSTLPIIGPPSMTAYSVRSVIPACAAAACMLAICRRTDFTAGKILFHQLVQKYVLNPAASILWMHAHKFNTTRIIRKYHANRLVCLSGGFGHGFCPKTERLDLSLQLHPKKRQVQPLSPLRCQLINKLGDSLFFCTSRCSFKKGSLPIS